MLDFRFFDPLETLSVVERKLPQWSQASVLCFLTFRARDSMPKAVVETFLQERNDWLMRHGINSELTDYVVMPNHVLVLVAFPDN